jgi:hypothetical protein
MLEEMRNAMPGLFTLLQGIRITPSATVALTFDSFRRKDETLVWIPIYVEHASG